MLTKYIVDYKMSTEYKTWCNSAFKNVAFTEKEKKALKPEKITLLSRTASEELPLEILKTTSTEQAYKNNDEKGGKKKDFWLLDEEDKLCCISALGSNIDGVDKKDPFGMRPVIYVDIYSDVFLSMVSIE